VLLVLASIALVSVCQSAIPPAGGAASAVAATPLRETAPKPNKAVTQVSAKGCVACVELNPMLLVGSDGTASGVVRICNRSEAPIDLDLLVTDFSAQRSDQTSYQLGSVATVTPETQSGLAKDACVGVKVSVSKLWQAGLLTAELRNHGQPLIELKAIRNQVPFNLKVAGPTPEKVAISFTRGAQSDITLRNEDPMSYRFTWSLELDGHVIAPPTLGWVAAGDVVKLPVTLHDEDFALVETGFLRSGAKSGQLFLRYEPDPSFGDYDLRSKQYPVEARLNYWNKTMQGLLNGLGVFVVLLVGIVVSLAVNYALPVQRKRIDVRERLADQEGRLAGLGNVVDSRTLSLLRSEKKRLGADLSALWPLDPSTEAALPKLGARIDWLDQRIDLTVKAGQLLEVLRSRADLAQPEIDAINEHCRVVLGVVEKPMPEPEEVKVAQTQIQFASALLAGSLARPTAPMLTALMNRQSAPSLAFSYLPNEAADWALFDVLFQGLKKQFLQANNSDASREDYATASKAVSKAELIVRFQKLVDSSGSDAVRLTRLSRAADLMKALLPGADESVQYAIEIVQQVMQNVSTNELVSEITKTSGKGIWIEIDPPSPIPRQLVNFRIHMPRLGFDTAVAQKDIECTWLIDDEELEVKGWGVCHFFEEKPLAGDAWRERQTNRLKGWYASAIRKPRPAGAPFKVNAVLRDSTRVVLATIGPKQVELERSRSYGESKTTYAIVALLVTVVAVGVGLLAGAQEKLQSLDWLPGLGAVLLLGFGADALKRALTKP
jgi:hypothetical protein